ncbi:hypothetical protein P3T37_003830 [Kitasatospora sp. MAA4]|nr:hypothetical protein [Kitasatospora sp. MAA4]
MLRNGGPTTYRATERRAHRHRQAAPRGQGTPA